MNENPFFRSIRHFFSSFRNFRRFNGSEAHKRHIVFYSESGQDWHHFEPVISTLLAGAHTLSYVSSDEHDPGLSVTDPHYTSFFIGSNFWLIPFFQFLKADCLVLTMIDLNVFHLKRSIHPVHYIYLFHSMGSTHMVDFENSYDHYDTILCTGPHQIREIRAREKLKSLPVKNLVPHGYARVEALLLDERTKKHRLHTPYRILLAPTWGPHSILPVCGSALAAIILDAGYELILRPHYQTNRLMPEVVQAIVKTHAGNTRFSYIDRMEETESLFTSDLLICDWSSTSLEYALGLEKPVLYIDVPRRVRNERYADLAIEPLEVVIRKEVGAIIAPDDLDNVPEVIRRLLSGRDDFRKKIGELREKVLFNIGNSVDVGAQAIAAIADEVSGKRKKPVK